MGFKLPGKSITSGTSAHRSALKMRAEENAASALKQMWSAEELAKDPAKKEQMKKNQEKAKTVSKKMPDADWKKGQKKAKEAGHNLDDLVKQRKGLKKGTTEYNKVQNKINAALGSKKRYDEGPKTKTETKVKQTKQEVATSKRNVTVGEAEEKLDKRTAQLTRREAKKKYGKDSKEFLEAKKAHLEAKEADRTGAKGGRKQSFFGKLSSRINKRRQEKIDKKLAKDKESSPNKNMKTGKYKQKFEK